MKLGKSPIGSDIRAHVAGLRVYVSSPIMLCYLTFSGFPSRFSIKPCAYVTKPDKYTSMLHSG